MKKNEVLQHKLIRKYKKIYNYFKVYKQSFYSYKKTRKIIWIMRQSQDTLKILRKKTD